MLADPITIAAAAPTPGLTLTVVKSDGYGSERRDAANGYTAVFNHQTTKSGVARHYLKVAQTLNAASPYTGIVTPVTCSASLSLVIPPFGFDAAAAAAMGALLVDVIEDTEVTWARFIGYES